jgi:DNA-binding transcriptional LysR family regulator
MRDRLVVVSSPALKRVRDQAIPVVVRSPSRVAAWDVTTAKGKTRIAISPVLQLSSMLMVRDAVRSGAGAAQLPLSLISRDLAAGRLKRWGDVDGPETTLWALYPSRRLLSVRVSAFLSFLKDAFPKGTPDELAAFIEA